MIQKEMLEYQQLDIEQNRIERELKKNENYVKRRQFKAARQDCEDNIARLDARAADLRAQLALAEQTVSRINDVIEEHSKEVDTLEDVDELNYMNKKLNEQLTELANVERDIRRILREGEEIAASFDEAVNKLPRLVAGYRKADEEFNRATAEVKPRVNEIRNRQAELRKSIDENLFNVYKKVADGGLYPVFVPLQDGTRCGGCRMEMPKAVVEAQLASKNYVKCEHCGRIIFKQE